MSGNIPDDRNAKVEKPFSLNWDTIEKLQPIYGATPINTVSEYEGSSEHTLHMLTQQSVRDHYIRDMDSLAIQLEGVYPTEFSDEFKSMIGSSLHYFTTVLDVENQHSFKSRKRFKDLSELHSHNQLSDAVQLLRRAELGFADPEGMFKLKQTFGMSSVELARLSHPLGLRSEHLPAMNKSVEDVITSRGGALIDDETYRFRIKLLSRGATPVLDNSGHYVGGIDGMMLSYKKDIGSIGNERFVARRDCSLWMGQGSPFDTPKGREITKQMSMVDYDPHLEDGVREGEDELFGYLRRLCPDMNLRAILNGSILNEQSTTIYVHDSDKIAKSKHESEKHTDDTLASVALTNTMLSSR